MANVYLDKCEFYGIDKLIESPYITSVDLSGLSSGECEERRQKWLEDETTK